MFRLNKTGNAVATILIISVLLVTSFILVQRSIYPSQSTMLERTQSTFDELVYAGPEDMLEAYAVNGYQYGLNSRWYCEDRNSAPNITKTKDDFTLFVQDELSSRIATLSEQFPDYALSITKPQFALVGDPDLPSQLNERATVKVTNFSLTIQDGDRTVTKKYDGTEDYDLRFWLLYKMMREWVGCNNGYIYETIAEVFEQRECAFFKDMCFCACDDCWTFCEPGMTPGVDCNDCPCGKRGSGLPVYTEESPQCATGDANFDEMQDFSKQERDEIIENYGIKEYDLAEIANRISGSLNRMFMGDGTCKDFTVDINEDTGIRCTAQVSNPRVSNSFRSAYALHPTGCIEQVDGTCGYVPISDYLSLACAGAPMCPPGSVLGNKEMREQWLANIEAGVVTGNCEEVEVEDIDGNIYTVIQCDDVVIGGEICVDVDGEVVCTETNEIDECSHFVTLQRANQGGIGSDPESALNLLCNPVPPLSDPPVGEGVGDIIGGTTRFKCIDPDSEYIQRGEDPKYYWFGMNGWIDRKGAFDLEMTCEDPGTSTTHPITAKMRLSVEFQHGCDSSQAAMRGWAPPVCRVPGVGTTPGCSLTCDAGPCYTSQCEEDEDGNEYCSEPVPRQPGSICTGSNQCLKYTCEDDGSGQLSCMESGEVNVGRLCGTGEDISCNECQPDGTCGPANEDEVCNYVSAACMHKTCQAGDCRIAEKPDGSPCTAVGCSGSCVCTAGQPTYSDPQECPAGNIIWTDCRTSVEPEQVCDGSPQNGYYCEYVGNPPTGIDTDQCCGGPGPSSGGVCSSDQTCCPGVNICRTDCGE